MYHVKRNLIIKLRDGKKLEASFGNSDCASLFCLVWSSSRRKWLCIDLPLFNNTFCFSFDHPCLLPHPPVTASFLYLLLSFFLPVSLNTVCAAAFFLLLCLAPQSCPTLCDPVDCGPWGSSVRGDFFSQEYWSGLPCPLPRDLPHPGIKPRFPALHVDSLPSEPLGKPSLCGCVQKDNADPGMLIKILRFKRGGLTQFYSPSQILEWELAKNINHL